ncbi:oxidoreductase [Lachnellula subtilissima]|uniref:laccase n=1 Tax=Lachnellula subtilissima TaxID=602034 RepID=A0A8H8UE49_9HELO|nr:oxidoreductase [Lachnellula subtilissima]
MSLIGHILSGALGIVASLSQQQTNGASTWGTLYNPQLPQFLSNNPLPWGFPWGPLTAKGDNPYTSAPDTGIIRAYDFTIKRGQMAPDGYMKDVLLINGQFPGPLLEANWGDTFVITVHNQIVGPAEGTALHWHGLLQKGSPWFDGVPAVQQCPIAPGASFTYTFKADLYGSSWYHSHYSAQLAGGLFGPMIIHGPTNAPYDIDLGPVMLSDYYHTEYFKLVQGAMASVTDANFNPAPASDNNLINGKMNFNCSTVAVGDNTPCSSNAGISKFKFTSGKTHRLRLMNVGGEGLQRFSIDGHSMTVIANDFVPIKPYTTNVVTLGIGQRSDVLVTANAGRSDSAFWMRSNISTICGITTQPAALAAIYYDRADTSKPPTSTAWDIPDPGTCANDDLSLTVPYYPVAPSTPSTTQTLEINYHFNDTGHFLWTLGANSFRADYNQPILLMANKGNFTYPDDWNVQNYGTNTTIRIVVNNPGSAAHPMHLHGHNMQIISEGPGNWDGVSTTGGNNPQRRDVQLVRNGGHMVMQFNADNPGVWPFHCHIAWHVSGGLYANLIERPADIAKDTPLPQVLTQMCKDWSTWSTGNIVDQIDSGL